MSGEEHTEYGRARAPRRGTTTAAGRAPRRTGPTGRWPRAHRSWTTGGVVAGVLVPVPVPWNRPTAGTTALVLGPAPVAMAVPAVLATGGGPAPASPGGGPGRAGP